MHTLRSLLVPILTLCAPVASLRAQAWKQVASPSAAGWDSTALGGAYRLADSLGSVAVFVVHRGVVVAAWGAVDQPVALTSVRKSLMATLFGAELRTGGLSLDATLGELGIDDTPPLDRLGRSARVRDLLSARSGIYRPAAQEPASWAGRRPPNGTHQPGEAWFYNNWSFNVVGSVYERWRKRPVFEGFGAAVASPLGMEDYQTAHGIRFREPSRSIHPAHAFQLSARDLARVGELYVRNGYWHGSRVLVDGWRDSVRVRRTEWDSGSGYGWLWWINPTRSQWYDNRPTIDSLTTIAAIGSGAQLLLVVPDEELVIVHLGPPRGRDGLPEEVAFAVAARVVAARPTGAAPPSVTTTTLTPRAFTARAPLPLARPPVAPSPEQLTSIPGRYDAGNGIVLRVFAFDDGLFVAHPQLGDLELSREEGDEFRAVGSGIRVSFSRAAAGVTGMTVHLPNGPIHSTRVR